MMYTITQVGSATQVSIQEIGFMTACRSNGTETNLIKIWSNPTRHGNVQISTGGNDLNITCGWGGFVYCYMLS